MCGILAIASIGDHSPSLSDPAAARLRDTLTRRGPDDAGLCRDDCTILAHRRLAIAAPATNTQPLILDASEAPRPIRLIFNGELYETDVLRRRLERAGCRPVRGTDTELLALTLSQFGEEGLADIRGMFGFVAWLPSARELLVGRDALGIIPLFWSAIRTRVGTELVIASEPTPILFHPAVTVQPHWPAVANYLMTLRTSCGDRTLFEGVHLVEPGTTLRWTLRSGQAEPTRTRWWSIDTTPLECDDGEAARLVRSSIEASIDAHRVADVPTCALLSGGLDSSIIAACLRDGEVPVRTFCAGAPSGGADDDLAVARRVAAALGTEHRETAVDAAHFAAHWPWMVNTLGLPLSTPNEVAIHAVGQRLRPHATVALSGEGADELFAGYGPALAAAQSWIAQPTPSVESWHADAFAWVRRDQLSAVLQPAFAAAADPSSSLAVLRDAYRVSGDPHQLRTHLDVQRCLNLPTLLQRLNTSLMLASVEGRTPFADCRVAELAARLPMRVLYATDERSHHRGGVGTMTLPRTKRVLRAAFADRLPDEALTRPKASFPLPFERWISDVAPILDASPTARAVLTDDVRSMLRTDSSERWLLAWPVVNLGLWLARWFDGRSAVEPAPLAA